MLRRPRGPGSVPGIRREPAGVRRRAKRQTLSRVAIVALVLALVVVAGARARPAPEPADEAPFRLVVDAKDKRIRHLERELRKARHAAKVNGRLARTYQRAARRRWTPTVDHAIRLASITFHVSRYELRAVASCESGFWPFARNGQYRGVFQEGPMFERGPYRELGVWDPYANVFTAASTVAREGWSQWECKP